MMTQDDFDIVARGIASSGGMETSVRDVAWSVCYALKQNFPRMDTERFLKLAEQTHLATEYDDD